MGEAARYVLFGGPILTLDPAHPSAEAVAIGHGEILTVGSRQEVEVWRGPTTEVIDLRGRAVMPGLIDAHLHLAQLAASLDQVDCKTSSKVECLQRVRARAASTPSGEWILGHGWNQNDWGEFGTTVELDAAAPNHPVYLTARSLHAAWANTRALAHARITPDTADPAGGRIGRMSDGRPSGILFEAAMRLVSEVIPPPSSARRMEQLQRVQDELLRLGLTAVHDFDGPDVLQALETLRERDRLRLRVVKHIPVDHLPACPELGLRTGFGDPWLCIGNIKLFSDGALGPRTAAMLEPYEGEPENLGLLLIDREALVEIGRRAAGAGLALAVHAIGDRANRVVLDAFDELRRWEETQGLAHLRHRIEHLQLLHPEDIPRVSRLGITASMQPIHATSDRPMAERYWGSRVRTAYAWRSLLQTGAILAFGSDAPVESPNPFWGIHAAVTRQTREARTPRDGWVQEQAIHTLSAFLGYTQGPAWATNRETCQGRLSRGAWADLIVLPHNPLEIEAGALAGLLPVATMVGGEWAFRTL